MKTTTKKRVVKAKTTKKTTPKKGMISKANYNAMNSLFLWSYNYSPNFIKQAFAPAGQVMIDHFKNKYDGLYEKYGPNGAPLRFVSELSQHYREMLFAYILKTHKS